MRGARGVIVIAAGALASCSLAVSWDDYTSAATTSLPVDAGGDASVSAAVDDAASAVSSNDGALEPASDATVDAGMDATFEASAALCTAAGQRIFGVRAFDATIGSTNGKSCNPGAVLVADGAVAGLDRFNMTNGGVIDGQEVNGCIGIDFAGPVTLASIAIVVGPAKDACGAYACKSGVDGCGTGHSMAVFAGPSRTSLTYIGEPNIGEIAAEHLVPLANRTVGTIVVCRAAWSEQRDDIAIDVVAGVCK